MLFASAPQIILGSLFPTQLASRGWLGLSRRYGRTAA